MHTIIRQGDVLLRYVGPPDAMLGGPLGVAAAPADRRERVSLAFGETTGHSHDLIAEKPAIAIVQVGDRTLAHLEEIARLDHPDHGPPRDEAGLEVPVLPGWWEVHRKREFVPPTRTMPARTRRVSD